MSSIPQSASRCKSSQRGRPAFAASQREKILELLRAAGPRGVSREELIFRYRWTQCGTRVFELRGMGYVIRSEDRGGRYPTWYVLKSEPLQLHEVAPAVHRLEEEAAMPLFAGGKG
jgi:hypothetical protein